MRSKALDTCTTLHTGCKRRTQDLREFAFLPKLLVEAIELERRACIFDTVVFARLNAFVEQMMRQKLQLDLALAG